MTIEFHNILDDIRNVFIAFKIDPRILIPPLQIDGYLSSNDVEKIIAENTSNEKLFRLFLILKNKSDNVFLALLRICHQRKLFEPLSVVQRVLKQSGQENVLAYTLCNTNCFEVVRENLKQHYSEDLEIMERFWQAYHITCKLEMSSFYNDNIKFKNIDENIQITISNADDLFSNNKKCIFITGRAGYGKTTFVHEMAHQWVIGERKWTKKFWYVFLFRLVEFTEYDAISISHLLRKVLCINDAVLLERWLNDSVHMKHALFIFDGMDEVQEKICKELRDLIFGGGFELAHVLITSRVCETNSLISKFGNQALCIELNGFNKEGVKQQLSRFSIDAANLHHREEHILKVPLYNALYCLLHGTTNGFFNVCAAIKKFVSNSCARGTTNAKLTHKEIHELIFTLGQAAQSKFSFMKNVDVRFPQISKQLLSIAINTGLLYKKSTENCLFFGHSAIAEYCAAYYFSNTAQEIDKDAIPHSTTSEPRIDCCDPNSYFSAFLSAFNRNYKFDMWTNFISVVPMLDEYESLPKRLPIFCGEDLSMTSLSFTHQSPWDQKIIMDKINFTFLKSENCQLTLHQAHFCSFNEFETIGHLKYLNLIQCSFKLHPKEFFQNYNAQRLAMRNCNFCPWDSSEDIKLDHSMVLENLDINVDTLETFENLNGFLSLKFLAYIMQYCTTLKSFKLKYSIESDRKKEKAMETTSWYSNVSSSKFKLYKNKTVPLTDDTVTSISHLLDTMVELKLEAKFENSAVSVDTKEVNHEDSIDAEFTSDWIIKLQNNQNLLRSIEFVTLQHWYPFNLAPFFKTLKDMANLVRLNILLDSCNFSESEVCELSKSFKQGTFNNLKTLQLGITSSAINKCDLISSISNLHSLETLSIKNIPIEKAADLSEIFKLLHLAEIELDYQDIFCNEQLLRSVSLSSVKKIVLKLMENVTYANFHSFSKSLLLNGFAEEKIASSNQHLFHRIVISIS